MRRIALLTTTFIAVLALTASAGLSFTHGGVRAGYVALEDIDNTIGFGGEIGIGIPVPNFSFNLEAGYWSKSYTDDVFTTLEAKLSDFNISVSGKYEINAVPNTFYPYFGAGFGLHFVKAEVGIGGISVSETESKFGSHVFGGFRVPFSPVVSVFAEGRYTVVNPDYFGLYGGLSYNFAK